MTKILYKFDMLSSAIEDGLRNADKLDEIKDSVGKLEIDEPELTELLNRVKSAMNYNVEVVEENYIAILKRAQAACDDHRNFENSMASSGDTKQGTDSSQKTDSTTSSSYVVKKGDTLTKIANRNNVTVDDLVKANNIKNPDLILIGQTLVIPSASGKAGGSSNTSTSSRRSDSSTEDSERIQKETINSEPDTSKDNNERESQNQTSSNEDKETTQTETETNETLQPNTSSSSSSSTTGERTSYTITHYGPFEGETNTASGVKLTSLKTMNVEGVPVYVYNYNGKDYIAVAAATNALKKSGYSKNNAQKEQPDKHYFNNFDTFTMTINNHDYDCIVLDSCGASMWEGEYRIDIAMPNNNYKLDDYSATIHF